jgi:hypothetical protein
MSVQKFIQPNSSVQAAGAYPTVVDAAVSVLRRLGDNFAPHAQDTPDMTISLDPGHVMAGQTLVEQAAQNTTAVSAPVSNPRIDRVVINNATGTALVISGTEAASPAAPVIPAGYSPVAQILLAPTTTAITNAMLTDERDFSNLGASTGALLNVQTFTSSGTYNPTPGTTKIIVEVQGGGGSGGACASTTAQQGAAAGAGSAGSFARALLTSGFSGVAVTVGAGGATTAAGANNGNSGSASSFGSTVIAPGGNGGYAGIAFVPNAVVGGAVSGAAPTGGNLVGSIGAPGGYGVVLSINAVLGGVGAPSVYGGGGVGGGNQPGADAGAPGAGGGGASSIRSSPARTGGAGGAGLVTVYEYA